MNNRPNTFQREPFSPLAKVEERAYENKDDQASRQYAPKYQILHYVVVLFLFGLLFQSPDDLLFRHFYGGHWWKWICGLTGYIGKR